MVDQGYTAIKTGGIKNCVKTVAAIRQEVGDEVDLMVDVHGPPWLTTRDAIALGRALEDYDLLFYEDPVAPENIDALARVADAVDIPIAAGERHATIWGVKELIEREIIDVVQPDTGRAGGLGQMKKIAAMAEAHYCMVAPHDGSLGPVAEMAAVHLMATLPNFLILEHLADDVPQRYEVMTGQPEVVDSHIAVPDAPGLGVDLVEEAIAQYPSQGNIAAPDTSYDYQYVQGAGWTGTVAERAGNAAAGLSSRRDILGVHFAWVENALWVEGALEHLVHARRASAERGKGVFVVLVGGKAPAEGLVVRCSVMQARGFGGHWQQRPQQAAGPVQPPAAQPLGL